ncbi:MAG: hypothetical protein QXH67_06215, partial [Candidatus Bathyarchaeia archaeon]
MFRYLNLSDPSIFQTIQTTLICKNFLQIPQKTPKNVYDRAYEDLKNLYFFVEFLFMDGFG